MVPCVGNDVLKTPSLVLQEVRVETLPRRSGRGPHVEEGESRPRRERDQFSLKVVSQLKDHPPVAWLPEGRFSDCMHLALWP